MKRHLHIVLCSLLIWLGIGDVLAQGELQMHFNRSLSQSSYTNPAFIQKGWSIGLPLVSSFGYAYNQRGLAFNDFFSKSPASDSLQLNLDHAIDKMSLRNYLSTETAVDVLSGACTNHYGSFGFNISEKAFVRASYSKELMQLIWQGSAQLVGATPDYKAYLNACRYREIGFRYARSYGKLDLGARVKLLQGLHNLYIENSDLFDLYIDTSAYALKGGSDMYLQTAGMHDRRGASVGKNLFNMHNLGLGLDLGANYTLMNGRLSLSASIVDLGSIAWRDDIRNFRSQGVMPNAPIDLNQGEPLDTIATAAWLDSIKAVSARVMDQNRYRSNLLPKSYISALAKTSPTVSWGMLLYTEYSDKPHVSIMLQYRKLLTPAFEVGASYAYINGTATNLGLGIQWQHSIYKGFVNTDNVFGLFGTTHRLVYTRGTSGLYIPASAQVCALRAGVMINLVKKEEPNLPSIPF